MLKSLPKKVVQLSLAVFLLTTSSLYAPRATTKVRNNNNKPLYKQTLTNIYKLVRRGKNNQRVRRRNIENRFDKELILDQNNCMFSKIQNPDFLISLVIKNDLESLELLSAKSIFYNPFTKNKKGNSAIENSVKIKFPEALILRELLLNEIRKNNFLCQPDKTYQILKQKINKTTILRSAVFSRNVDAINTLLLHGADSTITNSDNIMPIDIAATMNDKNGHEIFNILFNNLRAKYKDKSNRLKQFLNENRIPLNRQHTIYGTILHSAVLSGKVDIVKTLLLHGADANNKNTNGQTALHLAAFGRNAEVVKTLLLHGANVLLLNSNNKTPINIAATMNNKNGHEIFNILFNNLCRKYKHQGDLLRKLLKAKTKTFHVFL